MFHNPDDPASTYVVVRSFLKARESDNVIAQLQPWLDKPGTPRYFYYLISDAYAMKEDWQKAHENLTRYRYYKPVVIPVLDREDTPSAAPRKAGKKR